MTINDKFLQVEGFGELAAMVKNTGSKLHLQDCELSEKKLSAFGSRCESEGIQVRKAAHCY